MGAYFASISARYCCYIKTALADGVDKLTKIIRRFTLDDLDEVIQLSELLPEWFDVDARIRAIPIDLRFQEVFVCETSCRGTEEDGHILGFIALFIAEGRVNIGWMGVHPDHHRQDIGGLLIKAAEDFCRSIGVEELATYTLGDSVDYLTWIDWRDALDVDQEGDIDKLRRAYYVEV